MILNNSKMNLPANYFITCCDGAKHQIIEFPTTDKNILKWDDPYHELTVKQLWGGDRRTEKLMDYISERLQIIINKYMNGDY